MAKKMKPGSGLAGSKGLRRLFNVSVDKVAMTVAALATFAAAQQAQAAEKAKQATENRQADDALTQAQSQAAELAAAAEFTEQLPGQLLAADLEQLAEELAALGEGAEGQVAASGEVMPESLDGTMLSQATGVTELPPGVDARTTMSDSGASAGGGSGGSAGSAASAAGAEAGAAGSAAGGAAGGGLASMGSVTLGAISMPVAAIAGASIAAAAALAGGGGSGSVLSTAQATTTGLVVDGNVRDATIFYDRNNNGVLDAGEVSARTRADGSYDMVGDASLMTGKLVVLGDGFDVLTGQRVGMMTAPEGFAFVSPLTTLVAAAGDDAASQNAMLAKLGLSGEGLGGKTALEYLKTYDPVKAMTSGTPAEKALAEKAFTVSQQIFSVIQTAAELQSKVGGGSSAGLSNITNIATSIAQSIANAPATDGDGNAVSATSFVNQAANKAVEAALTSANSDVREALQANVTRALSNVNDAIAAKYDGLAAKLTAATADPLNTTAIAELAEKMAIAAVSQNTMIAGIRAIDTTNATTLANSQDSLLVVGDAQALQKLQTEVFVDAVIAGSATVENLFLTVNQALALVSPSTSKFTIVDTQAEILAEVHTNPVFGHAVGIIVTDPILLSTADDLIAKFPTIAFRNPEVSFNSTPNSLSYNAVLTLTEAGIRFPAEAELSVTFTSGQLDVVVEHAIQFQLAGVQHLSIGSLTLSLYDAYSIANAGLDFATAGVITLDLDPSSEFFTDDLATLVASVSAMAAVNIDAIGSSNGSLSISLADAIAIRAAGIKFDAADNVTVLVSGTDAASLAAHAADLEANGVDHIALVDDLDELTLTYEQATVILSDALTFTNGTITVSMTPAQAIELSQSTPADTVAAGIDQISLLTPSIALTALAPILDAGLILVNPESVVVDVTSADSALLASIAEDLNNAGINVLGASVPASLAEDAVFTAFHWNLVFESASEFTLQVDAAFLDDFILSYAAGYAAMGADHVAAASGTLQMTIAQAQAIIDAGLDFNGSAAEASVTFDPTDENAIAAVAAVAAELKAAGVDYIAPTSSPLALTLDEAESIFSAGFAFDPTVTVSLEVTSAELSGLLDPTLSALLISNNLDMLTVTDLLVSPDPAMPISAELAADLFAAGFNFAPSQNITLLIANAEDLAAAALNAADFLAGGLTTVSIVPTDGAALSAILASPTFAADIAALKAATFAVSTVTFPAGLELTFAEASAAVAAGLTFSEGDVRFSATSPEVTSITPAAYVAAGIVELELFSPRIGLSTLAPVLNAGIDLSNGPDITVNVSSTASAGLVINAANLADQGITELRASDSTGIEAPISLTYEALNAVGDNGLAFTSTSDVTATLTQANVDLPGFVADMALMDQIGVDFLDATNNALTLTEAQAAGILDAGLSFSEFNPTIDGLDTITVDAQTTNLSTSLQDLQKLGVDKVSIDGVEVGSLNIGLGGALGLGGLPVFADGMDVTLTLNSETELDSILAVDGLASELAASNIDRIDMAGDTATIDLAQAQQLIGDDTTNADDLVFASDDEFVSLAVDGASLGDVISQAQQIADVGVDQLLAGGALQVSDTQANSLVDAGLSFSADDTITVDAQTTNLSTSLQDLQKLGVDKVSVNGLEAGALHIGLGGALGLGGLPVFADGMDVTLHLNDETELGSILDVDGLATELAASNIDHIDMAGDAATIDLTQAQQLIGDDTTTADDLVFAADDTVSLSVDEFSLAGAASQAQQIADVGVDQLLAGGALTINEAEASSLVHSGLSFAETDTITVDAQTTNLSTSLQDLQKLGVDKVSVNGLEEGPLHIGLGGALGLGGLPVFADGMDVTLQLNDDTELGSILGVDGLATELAGSNIDHIDMVGDAATIDLTQAQQLVGDDTTTADDLVFAADDTVSLSVDAFSLGDVVGHAQQIADVGVDQLLAGGALTINEAEASSLVQSGLSFAETDTITVDAQTTNLSTSLQDLQKLGVDKVSVNGLEAGALHIGLGGALGLGGLPVFADGMDVTLELNDQTELDSILGVDGLAGDLFLSNIDQIDMANDAATIELSDLQQLVDAGANSADGAVFADDDFVSLSIDEASMGVVASNAQQLADVGVDELLAGGALQVSDDQASMLVDAGLSFNEFDTITVDSQSTNLSTSLQDLQKLGVDHVSVNGLEAGPLNIGLGGALGLGGLPVFADAMNVKLGLDGQDQLNSIFEGNVSVADLVASNIDQIDMAGNVATIDADQAGQLIDNQLTFAADDAVTLSLEAGMLDDALLEAHGLNEIGVDQFNMVGFSSNTAELGIDLDTANAMIDAGLSFDSLNNISLDFDQGASGSQVGTSFEELSKLGVDNVTYHMAAGAELALDQLPTFDQALNVTLDLSDAAEFTPDPDMGDDFAALGIDRIGFNEHIEGLASSLLGLAGDPLDGPLDFINGAWGLESKISLEGSLNAMAPANLDDSLGELFTALTEFAEPGDYGDLIDALTGSGITDMVIESGAVEVTDSLINALADAGMLQALPDANIAIDATASGDRMYTSLKEMADLDVDHVSAFTPGNLYIDLGQLGEGNALAEFKEMLSHLDPSMFGGASTPTLVMDNQTAEALSNSGIFDADILAGLDSIGIKEIGVLVGDNEQSSIVAQVAMPVEVKLIGQSTDPTLFDELHQPKQ
jgi:hypothetical protein